MSPDGRSPVGVGVRTAAAVALLLAAAHGHVRLDAPNGGETLMAGQHVTIQWTIVLSHTTVGWDLWYSTSGPGGPWIPVVLNLPPGNVSTGAVHTWSWRVPPTASGNVRVRVRQHNTGTSYTDVSDADLSIAVPPLYSDVDSIPLSTGGVQGLAVDGGPQRAGQAYVILGSVTGTSPGTPAGAQAIPLVPDAYFDFTLHHPDAFPLSGSAGTLASDGTAAASFTVPPGLPPSLTGVSVWHACVTVTSTPAIDLVSNAVQLQLVP